LSYIFASPIEAFMMQILVVDDDADVCHLMVKLFKRFGYDAGCATSGPEALKRMAIEPTPQLILLDMMMPEMSGMDVLKLLSCNGNPPPVPVIMFSALSDTDLIQEAMRNGASDYWIKATMDIQDIIARLSRFLPGPANA
jgi:CheY-like chemotaxis protein